MSRCVVTQNQLQVVQWVRATLGDDALDNPIERSLRASEEVIELAQACGADAATLHRLVDYVFARPIGDPKQEIGGCMMTIYTVAESLDVVADLVLDDELERAWTPEIMERVRRRQAEKREALVAKD